MYFRLIRGLALSLLGALVFVGTSIAAPVADAPPSLAITVTDDALGAPAQIEAGVVAVWFQNKGAQNHNLKFYRLQDGKTLADFKAAPGFAAAAALVEAYGGVSTTFPGQRQSVVLDLVAGQYVVASFLRGPPDISKALLTPLAVVAPTSGRTIAAPTADVTVRLTDTGMNGLPANMSGGRHTFEIQNAGSKPAQLILLKLAAGKTSADASAWLSANQAGPPPVDPSADNGGTAEFSSGKHGWLTLDLTPGTWFAFNNIPGPSYNVPVVVTVGTPVVLPAAGGVDLRIGGLLGGGLLAAGWFMAKRRNRHVPKGDGQPR